LEGGSVIPEEQFNVQDGVLFIEDKLTSLDFDNAEDQTTHSDKEIEWNEDSGVVSKDTKLMKNHTNKMTKNVVVDNQVDDNSSHFSQLSTTILQSEAESPHVSQLYSLNSYMEFSAIVIDGTRKTNKQKNPNQSNQMENTDITIQMFTPRIMIFSQFFNVTMPFLIILTRKN
jgi:hypothetical protein